MMRAGKGFFAAPVGRLVGNGGALGNGFHQLDDDYAEQSRCSFKMLWVRQTSAHSPWTLAKLISLFRNGPIRYAEMAPPRIAGHPAESAGGLDGAENEGGAIRTDTPGIR